jgi:hypothetical protein
MGFRDREAAGARIVSRLAGMGIQGFEGIRGPERWNDCVLLVVSCPCRLVSTSFEPSSCNPLRAARLPNTPPKSARNTLTLRVESGTIDGWRGKLPTEHVTGR